MKYDIDYLSMKDSNEDSFLFLQTKERVIAAVSDGVGSVHHAKRASKRVISLIKKIRNFSSITIHQELQQHFEKVQPWRPNKGYATLTLVVISPEENFAYVCGDGILYVNGKLLSSLGANVTDYFPYNHVIHRLPNSIENILLGTDGLSKYADNEDELKVILNHLMSHPLKNNDVVNMIKPNPIDDVTIIKIVSKSE